MQEGTKKTIIWETNSEPPRNYIWVKNDGIAYEYDWGVREWVPSTSLPSGGTSITCKTTAEWNEDPGYIPYIGELIVYTDYKTEEVEGETIDIPGLKIGNGVTNVAKLAFVGEGDSSEELEEHIRNTTVHITAEERALWNSKVGVEISEPEQKLTFTE